MQHPEAPQGGSREQPPPSLRFCGKKIFNSRWNISHHPTKKTTETLSFQPIFTLCFSVTQYHLAAIWALGNRSQGRLGVPFAEGSDPPPRAAMRAVAHRPLDPPPLIFDPHKNHQKPTEWAYPTFFQPTHSQPTLQRVFQALFLLWNAKGITVWPPRWAAYISKFVPPAQSSTFASLVKSVTVPPLGDEKWIQKKLLFGHEFDGHCKNFAVKPFSFQKMQVIMPPFRKKMGMEEIHLPWKVRPPRKKSDPAPMEPQFQKRQKKLPGKLLGGLVIQLASCLGAEAPKFLIFFMKSTG